MGDGEVGSSGESERAAPLSVSEDPVDRQKSGRRIWLPLAIVIAVLVVVVVLVDRHNDRLARERARSIAEMAAAVDSLDDVSLTEFYSTSATELARVTVVATNSGSTTADYFVTVAAESESGDIQYGSTIVVIRSLSPGQSGSSVATFLESIPVGSTARVKEVVRR